MRRPTDPDGFNPSHVSTAPADQPHANLRKRSRFVPDGRAMNRWVGDPDFGVTARPTDRDELRDGGRRRKAPSLAELDASGDQGDDPVDELFKLFGYN